MIKRIPSSSNGSASELIYYGCSYSLAIPVNSHSIGLGTEVIFSLCHAEPQRDKKICLLSGQVHKVQDRMCGACAGRRVTGKCMALAQYLGRETGKLLARRLA